MIKKIKNKYDDIKDKTFFKFAIVGVINTIVGTLVMFGAYNLIHFSYAVSTALNYIFGSILSYFLNKYYTFENKEKSLKQIAVFTINIFICYALAYGSAKIIMNFVLSSKPVAIKENAAMFLGMILFVVLNYFGQKIFVFKNNEKNK